ncbi:MAG: hypothetical protein R3F21_14125 [Myxococcota bacterium]
MHPALVFFDQAGSDPLYDGIQSVRSALRSPRYGLEYETVPEPHDRWRRSSLMLLGVWKRRRDRGVGLEHSIRFRSRSPGTAWHCRSRSAPLMARLTGCSRGGGLWESIGSSHGWRLIAPLAGLRTSAIATPPEWPDDLGEPRPTARRRTSTDSPNAFPRLACIIHRDRAVTVHA